MSDFALYTLAGILQSVGWPRKTGFLGRKAVVDVTVVDQAAYQLVEIGIGLGAGCPALAVHLLADAFQGRNWATDSATELLDSLDPNQRVMANPKQQPWKTISPPSMTNMGRNSIPWEWLGEPRIAVHYAGAFAQGLIWGLLHPKEAEIALSEDRLKLEQQSPMWRAAGLRVSSEFPWATIEDFYKNCEEIVANFVSEKRPLATTPAELQVEPKLVRRLKGGTR
ncbi:MAG: hypothetical protein AAB303_02150 [Chloroflexota bacterium]